MWNDISMVTDEDIEIFTLERFSIFFCWVISHLNKFFLWYWLIIYGQKASLKNPELQPENNAVGENPSMQLCIHGDDNNLIW